MRSTIPPAVVALAGARDGYQVPLALAEAGLLNLLVTDAYWPNRNRLLSRLGPTLLSRSAIAKRTHVSLGGHYVDVPLGALLPAGLTRLVPRAAHRLNRAKDQALSRRARQLAIAEASALLCYSYYAYAAFSPGPNRPAHRVLFQVHPHPESVRRILFDELERTPAGAASLRRELELAASDVDLTRLCREPELASGIIAASTFTARSLTEHGTPESAIRVVPYGVDGERFRPRAAPPNPTNPLKIIFIGSMVQRKGLSDLFEAVRLLRTRQVQLTLCGRGFADRPLLAAHGDVAARILAGLPDDRLIHEIQSSDVLVLPSLAEGFGQVILEAMACGVPVITTPNTGGPDVIDDGIQGFIVPVRSPGAVAEKLAWGLDHRDELAEMGAAAAVRAKQFTWERFRAGIVDAYSALITATPMSRP